MLESLIPLTLVVRAVVPSHLSGALSQIHMIAAFIHVAALPGERTFSMLHIIPKLALIHITVRAPIFLPFSETILDAMSELSSVCSTILPFIGAKTVRFTVFILASKLITIFKNVCAFASLETVDPFAFVLISILPLMNAIAVDFAI